MKEQSLKTVSLQTVGCRLNQYETEKMAADLFRCGFRRVRPGEVADLYIINTCTVTHRADSSNRYLINRAARENPSAPIVVVGCYVDGEPERVAAMPAVTLTLGNSDKPHLIEILREHLPDLFDSDFQPATTPSVAAFERYNRSWVKVSDGCNQWCAFCILPRVRGRLVNRPAREIVDEINGLTAKGFNEVALTGLHLGLYANPDAEPRIPNLASLCRLILAETDLRRIRLSSIEPQTVDDELLGIFTDFGDRMCRHLHMPLQSGSDRLLKAMRRPYDCDDYFRRVQAVRKTEPKATIGTDLIVGFPGETDDDFARSREVALSGLLDYLHVFSYSDRPGTAAAEFPDKVNPEVIKQRAGVLIDVSRQLRARAYKRQIGEVLGVIAEHKRPDKAEFCGISDNYIRVRLPDDYAGGRGIVQVRVTGAREKYVEGDLTG